MRRIFYLLFLFLVWVFIESCTLDNASNPGTNNINPVPTATPTVDPAATPTPTAISSVTPTATSIVTPTATSTITPSPTPPPTDTPTPSPTVAPTATPTYGAWNIPITLTENSGNALTDYQVCIDLSTDNITYSRVLGTNGEDLRFIVNGSDCPYWIQTWNATGKSRIWVKVPSLAANGTTTLNMYYGTAGATARTDGNTTMLIYDHFTDSTTDLTKWRDYTASALTTNTPKPYIFQSPNPPGIMQLSNTNNIAPKIRGFILSKNELPKNIAFDCSMKLQSTQAYFDGFMQCDGAAHMAPGGTYDYPANCYNYEWALGSTNAVKINKIVSNTISWNIPTTTTAALPSEITKYHTISMQYYNTRLRMYYDNTQYLNITDSTTFTTNYIGISTRDSGINATVYLDWVAVRNIVMPEPSVALGAEHQNY